MVKTFKDHLEKEYDKIIKSIEKDFKEEREVLIGTILDRNDTKNFELKNMQEYMFYDNLKQKEMETSLPRGQYDDLIGDAIEKHQEK